MINNLPFSTIGTATSYICKDLWNQSILGEEFTKDSFYKLFTKDEIIDDRDRSITAYLNSLYKLSYAKREKYFDNSSLYIKLSDDTRNSQKRRRGYNTYLMKYFKDHLPKDIEFYFRDLVKLSLYPNYNYDQFRHNILYPLLKSNFLYKKKYAYTYIRKSKQTLDKEKAKLIFDEKIKDLEKRIMKIEKRINE